MQAERLHCELHCKDDGRSLFVNYQKIYLVSIGFSIQRSLFKQNIKEKTNPENIS